jgi:hypothetical protein
VCAQIKDGFGDGKDMVVTVMSTMGLAMGVCTVATSTTKILFFSN